MQMTSQGPYVAHDIVHFSVYKAKLKQMYDVVGTVVYVIPAYAEATSREVETFYGMASTDRGFRGMLRALPCDRIVVLTQRGTFIVIPDSVTLQGTLTLVSRPDKERGLADADAVRKFFETH